MFRHATISNCTSRPAALLLLLGLVATASANEWRAGPGNYRARVARLRPGVTLHLAPGTYRQGLALVRLHGRPGSPVRIVGSGPRTVFVAREGANTVQIEDSSWIEIRDLALDGRGLAVDAVKAGGDPRRAVHHVRIEGLTIVGHGAGQQTVGISTKVPCWDWIIRGNRIEGAGTGMYLGDSDGSAPFVRGLIERNLVLNPRGYCLQIKHQNRRPALPGIPVAPSRTVIRYNLMVKNSRRGESGDRPNLLLGGFPDDGPGAQDRYHVHGNVMLGNPRESLMQATGRLSIHDNLFASCGGPALRVMTHHGKRPRSLRIYHNTIFETERALSISGIDRSSTHLNFGNLFVTRRRPAPDLLRHNVWVDWCDAPRRFAGADLRPGRLDLQPLRMSFVRPPAAWRLVARDVDHGFDFLGRPKRRYDHCGAFAWTASRRLPLLVEVPRWGRRGR